jgi:hypothetical protein
MPSPKLGFTVRAKTRMQYGYKNTWTCREPLGAAAVSAAKVREHAGHSPLFATTVFE